MYYIAGLHRAVSKTEFHFGYDSKIGRPPATPANCVACAPFINHTATLPFAQWEHRRGPTVEEGKSPRILAITLDQVERPA